MRYVFLLLVIFATTGSLFAQVYEVVSRDLGTGYMIAEGGTITVDEGTITEWNIPVTGPFNYTFTHDGPSAEQSGEVVITPDTISHDGGTGPLPGRFYFSERGDLDGCITEGGVMPDCSAELAWVLIPNTAGVINVVRFSYLNHIDSSQDISIVLYDPGPSSPYLMATVVPEPTGFCMGLAGLGFLGAWRKRIHRRRA